jgi:hypothetical protein
MDNFIEKQYFNDLFNRGGYVLDFTTKDFDDFTLQSVGIALCKTYNLPKGKSLKQFMNEGKPNLVIKLLDDLLNYYSVRFSSEIESGEKNYNGQSFADLYKKCREIIDKEKQHTHFFSKASENLKRKFSSEYMNQQIDLMRESCDNNPTEAIGKSKEIIESRCKTILEKCGENVSNSINVGQLVKQSLKVLNIPNNNIKMDSEEKSFIDKIIGSLSGLCSGIFELRNHYGSGHGHSAKFKGLTKRHAELSVGASITIVRYLWDTYLSKNKGK